jgi:hypothetical protein
MWEGWFQSEKLTDFIIEHAPGSTAKKDGPAAGNSVLGKLNALGVTINPKEHYIDVARLEVFMVYQEKDGKTVVRPIGDFIEATCDERDADFPGRAQEKDEAKQKFPSAFVFAGSQLVANGNVPKHDLADDSGDVISISTFGDEGLSLPEVAGKDIDSLMWEIDPTHLPAIGTKVMLRIRLLDKK